MKNRIKISLTLPLSLALALVGSANGQGTTGDATSGVASPSHLGGSDHANGIEFPKGPEDIQAVWTIPAPADLVTPEDRETNADQGKAAYERFVRAAWGFELDALNRYADRVMMVSTPEQQFAGFTLVLRSQAWADAILGDGARLEDALEIFDRGLAVRERVATGNEYDDLALDPLLVKLDGALNNAALTIQKSLSGIHKPEIASALAQLRDARPWYWWDDRAGEISAAQAVIPALRDRLLVDISTEAQLNQFQEELNCPGRTELKDAAGQHLANTRGANRKHNPDGGRLISQEMRVFDASHAALLEPIGPTTRDAGTTIER